MNIAIEHSESSRLAGMDVENLKFGELFTDHMFVCDFRDGNWKEPRIVPYGPIQMSPSSRVFHYGQAIFEGMKAYRGQDGKAYLFRPMDNIRRFNKSAVRLYMPEVPEDLFMEGLLKLVHTDSSWVPEPWGSSLYIRPFAIASQEGIIASPSEEFRFMIICAPANKYYSGEVRVKIEEDFSRAAPGGFGYAKAAGNYAGQFYPTALAREQGYQQIIWTNAATHEFIEEAGTMNIFMRIGDTLLTSPVSDSILDGITRKSLVQLARDRGIDIEVRPVRVSEVVEAAEAGTLKELFGAGTAAVVSPISGFGYRDRKFELPEITEDSMALQLKNALMDIQYGRAEDPYGWRVAVE